MFANTVERVPRHTAPEINRRIHDQTQRNIARCVAAGPEAVDRRLNELDQEWDIERTLEANAASLSLIGLGLGALVDRRFYVLPAAVSGFLLQHALQGWCPPLGLFRKMGVRTQAEIESERYSLKAMRGDFEGVSVEPGAPRQPMQVAESR